MLLWSCGFAFSMTIFVRSDADMIRLADAVVYARVHSVEARQHPNGRIYTHVMLDLEESWKGEFSSSSVELVERGGESNGVIDVVFGTPEYTPGDEVVVFAVKGKQGLETMDAWAGRFLVRSTRSGRAFLQRPKAGPGVQFYRAGFQPFEDCLRDFQAFREAVMHPSPKAVLRSHVSFEDLKDDPLLPTPSAKWKPLSSNNYRWNQFDSQSAEPWYYGNDPQIGFPAGQTSGDGPPELQRALATWTDDPSSHVYLTPAGQHQPYGAGWNNGPDGYSEVLFNDPYDEITGSFSCSSGGVLGFGGIHGISGSQVFRGESYGSVVEGDVVFQDWPGDCSWMNSEYLTEVIQHEVGHALGMGHSYESGESHNQLTDDALMRWLAHNGSLADVLGEDDRCGIYWLYPEARVDTDLSPHSSVTITDPVLEPDGSTTLTVNLNDGFGPLSGQILRAWITTVSGGATGTLAAGNAYPGAPLTDNGDGSYTTTVTAGSNLGDFEIHIRVNCCDDALPAPPVSCDAFSQTTTVTVSDAPTDLIFADGFDDNSTSAWTTTIS